MGGADLWKLQQRGKVRTPKDVEALPTPEELAKAKLLHEFMIANVLFDSVNVGFCCPSEKRETGNDATTMTPVAVPKPLVRHVLVKDLRSVAAVKRLALPRSGLFANDSPVALFALFCGQSRADRQARQEEGSPAAEWCARNFHTVLLTRFAALGPQDTTQESIKDMLQLVFRDLDGQLLAEPAGIQDGCGAAVAVLVGEWLFTAVVGRCDVVFCEPPRAEFVQAGNNKSSSSTAPVVQASSVAAADPPPGVIPDSSQPLVSRAKVGSEGSAMHSYLGDRAWKEGEARAGGALLCEPRIVTRRLEYRETSGGAAGGIAARGARVHPTLLLLSTPVAERVSLEAVQGVVSEFYSKPRAISGDLVAKAGEALSSETLGNNSKNEPQQYVAVTIVILPPKAIPEELVQSQLSRGAGSGGAMGPVGPAAPPPSKRVKTSTNSKLEMNSVRLRRILLRHKDCCQPVDPIRNRPVTRSVHDADALLRRSLRELLREQSAMKIPTDPKKAGLVHMTPAKRCSELLRDISECESARKAGSMCGDIGWQSTEELRCTGAAYAEAAKALAVGQWSDIVPCDLGLCLLQRIA